MGSNLAGERVVMHAIRAFSPANGRTQSFGSNAQTIFIPPGIMLSGHILPMRYLFPMSRDHLLPLIEYNVWRAIETNILIIGHVNLTRNEACRFMGTAPLFANPYEANTLPNSLKPTPLQRQTPHPEWIDLCPSPRMRDNAIRTMHRFSHTDLCADLLGGLAGRRTDVESGLRVWSNPWEAEGWELTEGFLRKWGFLVEGCVDLVRSTNRWRKLRGDESLFWKASSKILE